MEFLVGPFFAGFDARAGEATVAEEVAGFVACKRPRAASTAARTTARGSRSHRGGELTVAIMPGAMMGAEVPDLFDAGRAVEPKSGVDPQKNADVNLPRGIQSRSEFPLKK